METSIEGKLKSNCENAMKKGTLESWQWFGHVT